MSGTAIKLKKFHGRGFWFFVGKYIVLCIWGFQRIDGYCVMTMMCGNPIGHRAMNTVD